MGKDREDNRSDHKESPYEYCVLILYGMIDENNLKIGYRVNPRTMIRKPSELEKEAEKIYKDKSSGRILSLLEEEYETKFISKAKELGGLFGLADAIQVLSEDRWDVVTSMSNNALIFRRAKRENPDTPKLPSQSKNGR